MPDARSRDRILSDLEKHFAAETIYVNLDQVLREFVEEVRQL